MVDLNAVNDILSIRNILGAWTALFAVALWRGWTGIPAVMQQWIAWQVAKAAKKDAEWKRMSERLEAVEKSRDDCEEKLAIEREGRHEDVAALHQSVTNLRDALSVERAERMKFQRILDGDGEIRQAAAQAAAAVRADPEKAPESAKAAERLRKMRGGGNGGEGGEGI